MAQDQNHYTCLTNIFKSVSRRQFTAFVNTVKTQLEKATGHPHQLEIHLTDQKHQNLLHTDDLKAVTQNVFGQAQNIEVSLKAAVDDMSTQLKRTAKIRFNQSHPKSLFYKVNTGGRARDCLATYWIYSKYPAKKKILKSNGPS